MFYFLIPAAIIVVCLLTVVMIMLAMSFRTVVPTNDVHVVQSGRRTTSYGQGKPGGNVYYAWPSWLPFMGIKLIKLPVSVFNINLPNYSAYDKGRVPFDIDIMAFFRIDDTDLAAGRVGSFLELQQQLTGIMQGASRSVLAQAPIEEILEKRAEYGEKFTEITNDQLKAWGVVNVKNIELMDIRDAQGSNTIRNIMAVKQSEIERDSRVKVANNKQLAQTAEIEADRTIGVNKQDAEEQVGVRTALKEQKVGIAAQTAQQAIKEQEKTTAEKAMAVLQVQHVRTAEIEQQVQIVVANQTKTVAITTAEGDLQKATLGAQAVEVQGKAKGVAETAVLMAPVNAQIALADKIASSDGYQRYLIGIRSLEKDERVGMEQAKALETADVKIISNVGTPPEGLKNVMDIFSVKGGLALGAALEAITSTPAGQAISAKLGVGVNGAQLEEPKH